MYQFFNKQIITSTRDKVWDFISSPRNLKEITPSYMGFEITNEPISDKMYQGMIIAYKVSPILGIKINWLTEITHVNEGYFFVDEQRSGPYRLWHHQHKLTEIEGAVLMEDIVTYIPPFGIIGKIANSIFIEKQIKEIFEYRTQAVEKIFGLSRVLPKL